MWLAESEPKRGRVIYALEERRRPTKWETMHWIGFTRGGQSATVRYVGIVLAVDCPLSFFTRPEPCRPYILMPFVRLAVRPTGYLSAANPRKSWPILVRSLAHTHTHHRGAHTHTGTDHTTCMERLSMETLHAPNCIEVVLTVPVAFLYMICVGTANL